MAMLAVAALSARALAEAAARAGHGVLALDLFGDADTRRAANRWWCIGGADAQCIQPGRLCGALRQAASQHGAVGWIAGSGFEANPGLLTLGAAELPLIGNPAPVWARLQDPAQFFGCLDAHGLPHPALQTQAPADLAGWLVKDSAGCGGSAVQPADVAALARPATAALPHTACYQRRIAGRPVSATFIANGRQAVLLGFNQQRVQALPGRPYAFAGVVGPVVLPAAAAGLMQRALSVLVAEFGLRGLGSLDALLDGDDIYLLELNPRPPASLGLYPRCGALSLIDAHLQACLQGNLPASAVPAPAARVPGVAGLANVYARRAQQIDAATAARIAAWPGAHDLPLPGSRVAAGDPLCSLSATGASAARVHARLDTETERLLAALACPSTVSLQASPT